MRTSSAKVYLLNKFLIYTAALLYVAGGINHFVHPDFYIRLIPPYLPSPVYLNHAAGVAEIILGVMLVIKHTRKLAAWGIVLMLVVFIPVHVYTIQIACGGNNGCSTQWLAWVRLFIIHPFLIAWMWRIKEV